MARRKRYTVKSGDTFSSIAKQYGLESSILANNNKDIRNLRAGISLNVPQPPPKDPRFPNLQIGGEVKPLKFHVPYFSGAEQIPAEWAPRPQPNYGYRPTGYDVTASGRIRPGVRSPSPGTYYANNTNAVLSDYYGWMENSVNQQQSTSDYWTTAGVGATAPPEQFAPTPQPNYGYQWDPRINPTPTTPTGAKYAPGVYKTAAPATFQSSDPSAIQQQLNQFQLTPQGLFSTLLNAPDYAPSFISTADMVGLASQFHSQETFNAMINQEGYIQTEGGWTKVPGSAGGNQVNYMAMGDMSTAYGRNSWLHRSDRGGGQKYAHRYRDKFGGEEGTATGPTLDEALGIQPDMTPGPPPIVPGYEPEVPLPDYYDEEGFVTWDNNKIPVYQINTPGVTQEFIDWENKKAIVALAGKNWDDLTQDEINEYAKQITPFETDYNAYENFFVIRPDDLPKGFDFEAWADTYDISYFSTGDGYLFQYAPTGLGLEPGSAAYKTWNKDMDEIATEVAERKYSDEQYQKYLDRQEKAARGRAYAPKGSSGYYDRRLGGGNALTRYSYSTPLSPLMWRI